MVCDFSCYLPFLAFFPFLLLTFFSWPALFIQGGSLSIFEIHFPMVNISTLDAHEYSVMAFSLSVFVNILGALLGYLIFKKLRIQFPSSRWWKILWTSVGIICIVPYLAGLLVPQSRNVLHPFMPWNSFTPIYLLGFGFILLDTIILSELLENGRARSFSKRTGIIWRRGRGRKDG